jgi:hypothetical protein
MDLPVSYPIGTVIKATNGGCYFIDSLISGTITLTWNSGSGTFFDCDACNASVVCPTPTRTPQSTPASTPASTPTRTPTPTPTKTKTPTPTPTSGTIYLANSCCTSGVTKYVILPSAGLGSRRILIGGECYETISQTSGTPLYVGTLLSPSVTSCAQCNLIYSCPS